MEKGLAKNKKVGHGLDRAADIQPRVLALLVIAASDALVAGMRHIRLNDQIDLSALYDINALVYRGV